MRDLWKGVTVAGFLVLALLPVAAAAVSPEPSSQPPIPVAITQPMAALAPRQLLPSASRAPLSESGLLAVIGAGLLGLGAVVRKATRIDS